MRCLWANWFCHKPAGLSDPDAALVVLKPLDKRATGCGIAQHYRQCV